MWVVIIGQQKADGCQVMANHKMAFGQANSKIMKYGRKIKGNAAKTEDPLLTLWDLIFSVVDFWS